ncbi:hypothetical protein Nepgr_006618 [Nepenthes gracilis]|uniref:Uncharacterized protein n=1 Tax=Nepenthes gracilis TaxID=150966 RepID=A0AAD3S5H6_NEPGR|nr:hypothetical protein Nepgr_006618 [Nepenthes gracilis]
MTIGQDHQQTSPNHSLITEECAGVIFHPPRYKKLRTVQTRCEWRTGESSIALLPHHSNQQPRQGIANQPYDAYLSPTRAGACKCRSHKVQKHLFIHVSKGPVREIVRTKIQVLRPTKK